MKCIYHNALAVRGREVVTRSSAPWWRLCAGRSVLPQPCGACSFAFCSEDQAWLTQKGLPLGSREELVSFYPKQPLPAAVAA